MTVSPARAKLTAFAIAGFVAGLGGVLLGAVNLTFGPRERFFLVEDSLAARRDRVIGGLGSLAGAVVGALWVIGLPAFWPEQRPRAAVHVEHRAAPHPAVHPRRLRADRLLRPRLAAALGRRAAAARRPAKTVDRAAARRSRTSRRCDPRRCNADGTVLATDRADRARSAGSTAVNGVDFRAMPGEVDRPHRQQRRRQVDAAQRDRRLRAEPRARCSCSVAT